MIANSTLTKETVRIFLRDEGNSERASGVLKLSKLNKKATKFGCLKFARLYK